MVSSRFPLQDYDLFPKLLARDGRRPSPEQVDCDDPVSERFREIGHNLPCANHDSQIRRLVTYDISQLGARSKNRPQGSQMSSYPTEVEQRDPGIQTLEAGGLAQFDSSSLNGLRYLLYRMVLRDFLIVRVGLVHTPCIRSDQILLQRPQVPSVPYEPEDDRLKSRGSRVVLLVRVGRGRYDSVYRIGAQYMVCLSRVGLDQLCGNMGKVACDG